MPETDIVKLREPATNPRTEPGEEALVRDFDQLERDLLEESEKIEFVEAPIAALDGPALAQLIPMWLRDDYGSPPTKDFGVSNANFTRTSPLGWWRYGGGHYMLPLQKGTAQQAFTAFTGVEGKASRAFVILSCGDDLRRAFVQLVVGKKRVTLLDSPVLGPVYIALRFSQDLLAKHFMGSKQEAQIVGTFTPLKPGQKVRTQTITISHRRLAPASATKSFKYVVTKFGRNGPGAALLKIGASLTVVGQELKYTGVPTRGTFRYLGDDQAGQYAASVEFSVQAKPGVSVTPPGIQFHLNGTPVDFSLVSRPKATGGAVMRPVGRQFSHDPAHWFEQTILVATALTVIASGATGPLFPFRSPTSPDVAVNLKYGPR